MTTTVLIAGILLLAFVVYGFLSYRRYKNMADVEPNAKIRILTEQNFQQQVGKGISLVDFWASWCVPCKMMSPVLNETADELNGEADICKLNVEQFPRMASKHKVRSIPTMILFRDGKEINRFVGVKTKDFLIKKINSLN